MKEINLPLTQTFAAAIDLHNIKQEQLVDLGNGQMGVSFGQLVNDEISHNMVQARKNGGEILYATTSIEQQIEGILLVYFMGEIVGPNSKRELFEREVLQSTALSLSAKKDLLSKIVNEENLIKRKVKDKLQKQLKDILTWRNAFAHGKIEHNTSIGCLLKYYSGSIKKLELNDEFWGLVEGTFTECSANLKEIKGKLESNA